jgi:hypothetical protein
MEKLNLSEDTKHILSFIEEYKSIRNKPDDELEEELTELETCRLYSKTRSMGQD